MQQQRDYRLGHRFETLLAFWFEHSQRYQIIAQNLQVYEANRTIGEFDFIIKDLERNKVQHWEVACKFYLGLGSTGKRENWLGPMLKDRLNLKFDNMQQRQSLLSEQPAAQQLLQRHGLHIDESICLMKGRLFYPLKQVLSPSPEQAGNNHQRGWWARPDEFLAHYDAQPLRWRPLTKNQWLAPQQHDHSNINHNAREILQQFHDKPQHHPLCIVGFAQDESSSEELARIFLVAKDWAKTIDIVDNGSPN